MPCGIPIASRIKLIGFMRGSHADVQRRTILHHISREHGFHNSSSVCAVAAPDDIIPADFSDNLLLGIIVHFVIGVIIADPDVVFRASDYLFGHIPAPAVAAARSAFHSSSDAAGAAVHTFIRAAIYAVHAATALVGSALLATSDHPRRAFAASFVLSSVAGRRGRLQRIYRVQQQRQQREQQQLQQ
jgi:hypothetical protein